MSDLDETLAEHFPHGVGCTTGQRAFASGGHCETFRLAERARTAEAKVAELRDQRETAVLYLTLALGQTHPESPTFWTDLRILAAVRSALSAVAEVPLPDDVVVALGGDHEQPEPEEMGPDEEAFLRWGSGMP